jgi:hypothetical protein
MNKPSPFTVLTLPRGVVGVRGKATGRLLKKSMNQRGASEKEGLNPWFVQQTGVFPDRFSRLNFLNTPDLIFSLCG